MGHAGKSLQRRICKSALHTDGSSAVACSLQGDVCTRMSRAAPPRALCPRHLVQGALSRVLEAAEPSLTCMPSTNRPAIAGCGVCFQFLTVINKAVMNLCARNSELFSETDSWKEGHGVTGSGTAHYSRRISLEHCRSADPFRFSITSKEQHSLTFIFASFPHLCLNS